MTQLKSVSSLLHISHGNELKPPSTRNINSKQSPDSTFYYTSMMSLQVIHKNDA